jgi:hypothetical protein
MSIWLIIRAALFVMPSVVVLLVMTYPARPATTFVASNVGNDAAGTPCTDSVPCSVRRAILTANCANNDVIELLDGTYTGANYMLDVFNYAGSKSGTDDTHRCTIRARNDGGVLIDGQNTRTPLWLQGNSWWTVEGINARDGDDVFFVKNSSNLILRRLVGWDTKSLVDRKVFIVESSTNVLVEDVGLRQQCQRQMATSLDTNRGPGVYPERLLHGEHREPVQLHDRESSYAVAHREHHPARRAGPRL